LAISLAFAVLRSYFSSKNSGKDNFLCFVNVALLIFEVSAITQQNMTEKWF